MSCLPARICSSPALPPWAVVDLEPLVPEQDAERVEDPRLVVDDEDRRLVASCGILRHHLGGQKDGERGARARAPSPRAPAPGAPRPRAVRWRARARCRRAGRRRTDRTAARGCPPGCPGPSSRTCSRTACSRLVPCGMSAPCTGRHRDRDADRPPGRLDRVEHQVGDDPVQQVLVAVQDGAAALDRELRVGPAVGVRLDQPDHRPRPPRAGRAARTGWPGPGRSRGTRSAAGSAGRSPGR